MPRNEPNKKQGLHLENYEHLLKDSMTKESTLFLDKETQENEEPSLSCRFQGPCSFFPTVLWVFSVHDIIIY